MSLVKPQVSHFLVMNEKLKHFVCSVEYLDLHMLEFENLMLIGCDGIFQIILNRWKTLSFQITITTMTKIMVFRLKL